MPQALIIVPCYNEASRFDSAAMHRFLAAQTAADLCFVNDGSTDNTQQVLDAFAAEHAERARVLHLDQNLGKAGAVRAGVLQAMTTDHAFVGYWDADLATPLDEVTRFLAVITNSPESTLAVFGSRVKRLGASITRSLRRHLVGRVFATLASLILRLPVYDSQCGAKLFKRSVLAIAFQEPFATRWLFDVEILARLRDQFGSSRVMADVIELPLSTWDEKGNSKLTLRALTRVPLDLWRIYCRYPASGQGKQSL